jgi:hypothetical protein
MFWCAVEILRVLAKMKGNAGQRRTLQNMQDSADMEDNVGQCWTMQNIEDNAGQRRI